MLPNKNKFVVFLSFLCLIWLSAANINGQNISFNYYYKLEAFDATEPPQIDGVDVDYPEIARKNGVEGTLKAVLTLGENGKTREISVGQPLPHGVTEAVVKALQKLSFQPARRNGQPVASKMLFDFVVTAAYDEDDKMISKPKITEKPAPAYPAKYASEKVKGKVIVQGMFFPNGTIKVLSVGSTMPREFDEAAAAAAAKIKFEPGHHKKSKNPVATQMAVEYDFKP